MPGQGVSVMTLRSEPLIAPRPFHSWSPPCHLKSPRRPPPPAARPARELLGNLFYEGSPLHDGAIIIRRDKIYAAGCVLPLTDKISINKSLGTRHRAGIGITENSDAVTLIVSEETGIVSMAKDGKITRFLDKRSVENMLLGLFTEDDEKLSRLSSLGRKIGRGMHVTK